MEWEGREVADWEEHMMNGLDLKYVDTDGNGLIDEADVLPILANYNRTHSHSVETERVHDDEQNIYELRLNAPEEVVPGQAVSFGLELGSDLNEVSAFYGIAFTLSSDVELFTPGSFSLSFQDSWLGTADELLTIAREFPDEKRIEIAFVRRDGAPRTGSGKIADLNFVMSEDLIISIETSGLGLSTDAEIDLREIEAVNHEGLLLNLDYVPAELVVVSTDNPIDPKLRVFPNPAYGEINLSGEAPDLLSIELFNNQGQAVASFPAQTRRLDVSAMASGLYYLRLTTVAGEQMTQKVMLR